MSVVDQFKSVFSRGGAAPDADSRQGASSTQVAGLGPGSDTVVSPRTVISPARTSATQDAPVKPGSDTMASAAGSGVQQRRLALVLGGALLVLAVVTMLSLNQSDKSAQQLGATGQALVQSQRLAKSVSLALAGNAPAFADLGQSAEVLSKNVRGLASGSDELHLAPVDATRYAHELEKIMPLVERAEKSAKAVSGQQKVLVQIAAATQSINRQSADLLEMAEAIISAKVQQNASAADMAATAQLVMLTQRIGKASSEILSPQAESSKATVLLGKDLASFKDIAQALVHGSAELHLAATKDSATREQIVALLQLFEQTRAQADVILGNLPGLAAAREATTAIVADSEALRRNLEELQSELTEQVGIGMLSQVVLALAALVALVCAGAMFYVQSQDGKRREQLADEQRLQAQRLEQEAKRVNDANQAAILRLMNELQTVAEGDLTQEATVTEDITGAIADSVNYTVEELRSLVANVQTTADRVALTTAEVDATSTELLAASNEQLHEIRDTGKSVVDMAGRINDVSAQAQESATVARQSLQAAESGLRAVQNAIGGMNSIRDQIQDTAKRIKRLGESSQEIGEITELISDITEQTNVLALNAAIQAASAGEAGRGFSVVAEEVQRLAERSADATRQIAALVKALQTDTQDAIGAMERSTQGVVEGAKLSDNAGTALTEIDRVSRRVAELIEQISLSASREAGLANDLAGNIQHIFAVTEQTGDGTRSTANQVRELSRMAEELRQSVSRFKIV